MYQAYNTNKMMPPLPYEHQQQTSASHTAQAQGHRRNPLSNAVNHHVNVNHPNHNHNQPAAAQQHTQNQQYYSHPPQQQQQYLHPTNSNPKHGYTHTHTPPRPPPPPHKEAAAAPAPPLPPKPPVSPPLPRQNAKIAPPSPPKIITDKLGRVQFQRVGFLGEGGFARVYEVKDHRGSRLACKVVTKSSLKTKKAKTKLYAEIKIHRSLQHPNIVHFQDCFEDTSNVYMTLELCTSGSLMEMLRRRRRFTEPEARFFMVQLIGACHYMHAHQVIHRDLKLGNLFLDGNMNVKVGDFGLAALIESPGERKKTICGTPNYIAPEVLFDTANGHSFEVDTWSVGVILYTLVIGRPPFQTKDVKAIYKRIRDNEYEFPADKHISYPAQNLIAQILTPEPSLRPSLHQIVDHGFFTEGTVPAYIPTSAHDAPPDFSHVSRRQSGVNLGRLRRGCLLDVDFASQAQAQAQVQVQADGYDREREYGRGMTASASAPTTSTSSAGGSNLLAGLTSSKSVTASIAQQEKEFQKAVQPGSPISALLSSARQPLVMGSAGGLGGGGGYANMGSEGGVKESPLLRKLQAAATSSGRNGGVGAGGGAGMKESPLGRRTVTRGLDGIVEERERSALPSSSSTAGATAGATGSTTSMRRRLALLNSGGGSTDSNALTIQEREREREREEEEQLRLRKKELEAQKARIVAQMAPVREEEGEDLEDGGSVEGDDDGDGGVSGDQESDGEGEEGEGGERDVDMDRAADEDPEWDKMRQKTGLRSRERERERGREGYGDLRADRENVAPPAPPAAASVRGVQGQGQVQRLASGSTRSNQQHQQQQQLQHHRAGALGGGGEKENGGLAGRAYTGGTTTATATTTVGAGARSAALGSGRYNLDQRQAAQHQLPPQPQLQPQPKLNGFDAAAYTLTLAFDARAAGKIFRHPLLEDAEGGGEQALREEKVFIVSWVDYCNKYGMGYALTDGSVGVHFNDSTTLVLSPDKEHFDYITSRRQGTIFVRKSYTVSVYPDELKSKVYLLKHFERYIMERLYGEYEYTYEDVQRERGMEWVQKYLRMKHVIVFKLSHDVLQFNFYDHSKLILSSQGLLVTHIDKHYKMTRWTLREIMAHSLSLPSSSSSSSATSAAATSSHAAGGVGVDPEQVKAVQKLVDKLKYCKEVLVSIKNAGGQAGQLGAAAPAEGGAGEGEAI